MTSIGMRLCEERQRLGNKTQTDFAEFAGVKRNAQSAYENGDRFPDADYLAKIALKGADVLYIVTGQRSSPLAFPDDELLLLEHYRKVSPDNKEALLCIMDTMAKHG